MAVINNRHRVTRARLVAGCGMLTAAAFVLQYLEFPLPFLPSFIKLDFSDLPELIGAYAYGPLAGVIICLLKNLIHLTVSQSGFIGELSNFLLGAVFSITAGLVYTKKRTKSGAWLSGILASLAMAAACFPLNLFVVYPLYYSVLHLPEPAILDMYQAILPAVKDIPSALLVFNVPFTLLKGVLCVLLAMLLYKRIAKLLFTGKETK